MISYSHFSPSKELLQYNSDTRANFTPPPSLPKDSINLPEKDKKGARWKEIFFVISGEWMTDFVTDSELNFTRAFGNIFDKSCTNIQML